MIWTTLNTWYARRIMQRSRHGKALKELPPSLYDYWKSSAGNEYHGIPTDAVFFARSAIGLLDFFECAAKGSGPCALPSKAADSVWHAWLRLSPLKLEVFCRKHFGRVVPHVEGAAMGGNLDSALAVCLVRARAAEGIAAEGPRLPSLFLLDKKVKMPFGYGYSVLQGRPGYSQLDAVGGFNQATIACPPQLAAAGLMGAGLITAAQYAEFEERARQQASTSGSSCGSGCGSTLDCSSSSSSCDSGGSSCGSSCGGGGGD